MILDILLVLFIRNIRKQKWMAKFDKKWNGWAKRTKKIPFWQHVLIVFLSLCFSVASYLVLVAIYKPHFSNPPTTAINWYTVHNYPRQQDTFYFVTSFVSILLLSCFLWLLWILQKNKK
jgi:hypothetical protein